MEEDFEFISPLTVGDKVLDIDFQVFCDGEIKNINLKDFEGKWLILFFYPGDFTFVCPTELKELSSIYEEFKKEGAEVMSVSPDSVFSHKVWKETSDSIKDIKFPMAADVKDELSCAFGTYCDDGTTYRGTFIIDPEQIIRSVEINDNSIGRSAKELLRKFKAAKYVNKNQGQVCPASWEEGEETLKPKINLAGKI